MKSASSNMPFQLELADDPLANDNNLTDVWQCSDTQVAFQYDTGVVVYLSQNTLSDPSAVWKKMAEEYPEFSTGTVRGVPASLVDPTKAQGAEGGVDLVEGDVRLTVSGNGKIPLDDLIRVAETISPDNTAT